MYPPVFGVLTLALVCAVFGTALEETADRASKHTMPTQHHFYPQLDTKLTTTTPDQRNNKIEDKTHIYDDIYIPETIIEVNEHRDFSNKKLNSKNKLYNENDDIDETGVIISNALVKNKNKYFNFGNGDMRPFEERLAKWKPMKHIPSLSDPKILRRTKREDDSEKCQAFEWNHRDKIQHPHAIKSETYYSQTNCITVISASAGQVIQLTFVDVFQIEEHPTCEYDFLEIRNGKEGYAELLGKFCGFMFPSQLVSTGPYMWLKFHSDETIEYKGFTIKVDIINDASSHMIPQECYLTNGGMTGSISAADIPPECSSKSGNHAVDVLWNITTAPDTYIFLNFTQYALKKPNECEVQVVQVFGHILDETGKLANYCGSVANSLSTKVSEGKSPLDPKKGNIIYVRLYASQNVFSDTKLTATFTAFKPPNTSVSLVNGGCGEEWFNCEDNTCIYSNLTCTPGLSYAHCRLKTDLDPDMCSTKTETINDKPHILIILVIFCLILSGMSFVFLFKCLRKLYQDHKIIKEHISQSQEDRLDTMIDERFPLDPNRLQRDSAEPRVSLERENHMNKLLKQQRSISQHKQPSIESEYEETRLDFDDEPPWRNVEPIPEAQDIKIEPHRNGRPRRSDTSKKEESIRSRKESIVEKDKKEIKDVAVGAPDTKESSCQTRESLFQVDPAPSSDGSNSNSNSRGFSTFGYSGATLVRPSPPPAISSVQIELLRQIPSQDLGKSQKKIPDRRPMSTETTRSAPDVIIVSKPIR